MPYMSMYSTKTPKHQRYNSIITFVKLQFLKQKCHKNIDILLNIINEVFFVLIAGPVFINAGVSFLWFISYIILAQHADILLQTSLKLILQPPFCSFAQHRLLFNKSNSYPVRRTGTLLVYVYMYHQSFQICRALELKEFIFFHLGCHCITPFYITRGSVQSRDNHGAK